MTDGHRPRAKAAQTSAGDATCGPSSGNCRLRLRIRLSERRAGLPIPPLVHDECGLHAFGLVTWERAEQGVATAAQVDAEARVGVWRRVRDRPRYRSFGWFECVQIVFGLAVVDEFDDHPPGGNGGAGEHEAEGFGVFGSDLDTGGGDRARRG